MGEECVASKGNPTCRTEPTRVLFSDGMLERITPQTLYKCGRMWCACGRNDEDNAGVVDVL